MSGLSAAAQPASAGPMSDGSAEGNLSTLAHAAQRRPGHWHACGGLQVSGKWGAKTAI